ncbi:MAG: hypothetical protein JWM47_1652 [Acidimicrobiales bacterium]|nr:hypothetical protein [Acidimicrobiales bacterium]
MHSRKFAVLVSMLAALGLILFVSMKRGNERYHYLTDDRGSIGALTDATGTVCEGCGTSLPQPNCSRARCSTTPKPRA